MPSAGTTHETALTSGWSTSRIAEPSISLQPTYRLVKRARRNCAQGALISMGERLAPRIHTWKLDALRQVPDHAAIGDAKDHGSVHGNAECCSESASSAGGDALFGSQLLDQTGFAQE